VKVGAQLCRAQMQHSMAAPYVKRVDNSPLPSGGHAEALVNVGSLDWRDGVDVEVTARGESANESAAFFSGGIEGKLRHRLSLV